MAKITLKPLDDGQKAVEIPLGKTTIGRGPFLGCGDKKVSRNHAVLEVTDHGEVFITPTHVNPCFFQPTADNPGTVLRKDKRQKLKDGDTFSLLPRAFRYMLVMNNDATEENNKDSNVPEVSEKINGMTEGKAKDNIIEADVPKNDKENACRPETPESEGPSDVQNFNKDNSSKDSDILNLKDGDKNRTSELNGSGGDDDEDNDDVKRDLSITAVDEEIVSAKEEDIEKEEEFKETPTSTKMEKDESKAPMEEEEESKEATRTLPDWLENLSEQKEEKQKQPDKGTKQSKEKKSTNKKSPVKASSAGRKRKTERRSNNDSEFRGEHSRQSSGRSSRTNRQTRQGLSLEDFIASDDDEWQSDESEPVHKRRRRRKRRDDDSGSDWEIEHKKTKRVSVKYSSGSASESGSDWGASSQKKKKAKNMPKPKRKQSKRTRGADIISDEEEEDVKSEPEKPEKRIPCTYGEKCYRKNQNHLDQFSHPGDSDYASESEVKNDSKSDEENEENSKKKECPFGANCFRKNPQHKKEYKHTKKVRPKREAAKQAGKKTKVAKDNEEPSSYDLNDTFSNDDSDEYKPAESGSDYDSSQDLKRLAKGAKENLKTKKGKPL